MRAREDLAYLGGMMGANIGRCVFSESETCQQFVDALAGGGMRDGESYAFALASLRWQYVNLPDRFGPFWRIFAGGGEIHRSGRHWEPVFGAGYGITNYLHDKVDLRLEVRVGVIDRVFAQTLIGAQIKGDLLLSYFAAKLRDLGYGTISTAFEATGTALEATGEGLGGIVEGVSSSIRDQNKNGSAGDSRQPSPPVEK